MRHGFVSCVLLTLAAIGHLDAAADTPTRHYLLPSDAGIVNVKDARFGAAGDGRTDDTAAIREAIKVAIEEHNRYSAPPFVFFPKGTYLVTGPLESKIEQHGWSGGWRAGMLLLGESRADSIIKLADRTPGYRDPSAPRP